MSDTRPASDGAPDRPRFPPQIGPYRLLDRLGEGGMGTVYLAEQTEPVRRRVALKVVRGGMESREVLSRFRLERDALAVMNHPNIAKILDAGATAEGAPYFVMELVQGEAVTAYCDRHRLALRDRIALFLQACQAVQHAHHKGVVHRDLKPSNVLVEVGDQRPTARIIDFGLARATNHLLARSSAFTEYGRLIGTPEYMSPEQAEMSSADVDTRTDVYSLGVLLYELLAGALPFSVTDAGSANLLEVQRRIREVEPPRPSRRVAALPPSSGHEVAAQRRLSARALVGHLQDDLDWIVLKCLEKDRTRRYQTPLEIAADLERHLRGEPVVATRPSAVYLLRKLVRRHRAAVVGVLAVFVTMVVALILVNESRAEANLALETLQIQRDGEYLATLAARAPALRPVSPQRLTEVDGWLGDAAGLAAEDGGKVGIDPRRVAGLRAQWLRLREQVLVGPVAMAPALRLEAEQVRELLAAAARDHAAAWSAVRARVAADPRFADAADLVPATSADLVPLGPDPVSGLEEFAHLFSGSIPTRDPSRRLVCAEDAAIVLVLVPGGRPWLGASVADAGAPKIERPGAAAVRLRPFLLGKYELTRAQWCRLSGRPDPSRQKVGCIAPPGEAITPRSPVESIDFVSLQEVLRRFGMDLPTEAQWEHACRAGTATTWWPGDDRDHLAEPSLVNINDETARAGGLNLPGVEDWPDFHDGYFFYVPAGLLPPNPWGIHEILGNVKELCRDAWVGSHADGHRDGDGLHLAAPAEPDVRVARGGSWQNGIKEAKPSARKSVPERAIFDNMGGRPSREW